MVSNKSLISKKVTIYDVAERAGVSTSLVSIVMNAERGPNGEYLCGASQKTAKKIIEVADRLGYHSNQAAISLRLGCTKTVGVVVPDISNMFFADICQTIETLAMEAGYLTLMGSSRDLEENVNRLVEKFLFAGVDGMVVTPCPRNIDVIRKVQNSNIPVVLLDRDITELTDVGRVMIDNVKSGRIAARMLIERDCRDTMLIRYETDIHSILDREAGYMSMMRENGFNPKVSVLEKDKMNLDIVPVLKEAVRNGVKGVVLPSNSIMLAGVAAVNKLGLKIPEDIEVVGFDQDNRCDIFNPAICFVNQPAKLTAESVFTMLHSAMNGEPQLTLKKLDPLYTHGFGPAQKGSPSTR